MAADRYSRPIGRLSQRGANRAVALLTTITFLGERQDIFDPEAAVPVAGQTTEADVLSASSRSTTCRVTPTRSPAGPSPDPGSTAVPYTFGFGARRSRRRGKSANPVATAAPWSSDARALSRSGR